MKTAAFLIRVTICFLLSLIPVTELENRIYSARMEFRGPLAQMPDLVILDIHPHDFNNPVTFRRIRNQLSSAGPSAILHHSAHHWKELLVDSDGMVRRSHLNLGQGNTIKRTEDVHHINFWGPAGTFPRCSAFPKTEDSCPPLEGKIVLLNEDSGNSPTFHTPIGEMSSAEVLANDIETLVHQQPIHQVSIIVRLVILLAMTLIAAFYIIYYPVLVSAAAIILTGILVVLVLFQIAFEVFNVYFQSANIICSLLITYLIFTGYRLAIQENLQWRSLKQAQYLRELDRMKTNFLTLVSHDLKTPLAKIQAIVERMRRELPLPFHERSDWKEMIDSIENSNNEMKHFITSIMNLSKIESQKVILNKKSNDINLLIQQALKRLRPLAQQKNIKIEESLDPLFSIECDADLMRQVLTNLIDNAIKYSPQNSKILVRSKEEEGFVRVEVEDFGPGIPKDQLPLMFRKFSRFLRPIKEPVKGSGLGLYLSKYFIELHGGTIRVKSLEGQGTTFSFTLPLNGAEGETLLS